MSHFSRLLLALSATTLLLVALVVVVDARPPNIFELDGLKRTADGGFDPLGLEELTKLNKNVFGKDAIRQPPRAIPTEPQADGPIAQTQYGAVQGYLDDGINTWRGVPYAAPPTGDFRLREPQDALSWNGTLNTYSQAQICPQIHIFDWLYLGDEDCLYADVYSPADATPSNPKPVFVWIFGGGWVIGDGYEFGWYDGHNVAKARDHVIVTFNYRLGPLGFMANDALRADNPNNYAGSWGLLDQVKLLQWVQTNIAQFGGDPTRVTIGGESAGAFSTCWHMASPLSKGLFHAAILESGTCDSQPFFTSWQDSRNWTNTYIGMVGCNPDASDVLTCIRGLPTGVIMGNILSKSGARVNETITSLHAAHDAAKVNTQWGFKPLLYPLMSWGATIDGVSLLDVPLNQIQTGEYNNVPVIMGTNNDEGTLFTPSFPIVCPGVHYPIQNGDIAIALNHVFSGNTTMVDMVLANYPIQDFENAGDCLNQLFRDYMFVCPTHRALKTMTAQGANTWMYHWDYKGHWIDDLILGDYHTAELTFVWDNQWPLIVHAFDQDDYTMADSVDTYWSNLVWYLNPNGNGTSSQEYWPVYDPVNQADMILAVPTQVEQNYKQSQCVFWDTIDAWNRVKGDVPTKTTPAKSTPAAQPKPKIVLTEQ